MRQPLCSFCHSVKNSTHNSLGQVSLSPSGFKIHNFHAPALMSILSFCQNFNTQLPQSATPPLLEDIGEVQRSGGGLKLMRSAECLIMHYDPRRAQRGLFELITHYELRIMNYAL